MRAAALVIAVALVAVSACGSSSRSRVSNPSSAPARPQPVKFPPGGVRTLAQGALPDGDRFAIFAQHYRSKGARYLDLGLETGSGSGGSFRPAQTPGPIAFASFGECSHPSLSIVYGLLRAPRDSATLTSRGVARPLTRAPIPSDLHMGGMLAYGLTYTSATLTVKSPSGRVTKSVALPNPRTVCSRKGRIAPAK